MKCTLHIGTAKTGTTSIQSFFFINRDAILRTHGILYPQLDNKFRTGTSHRALAYYAAGDNLISDPKWSVETLDEKHRWESEFKKSFRHGFKNEFHHGFGYFKQKIFKKSPSCTHYFLSSEHLHSRITKKSQVARMVELLSEFFDEINVVVFLKAQSSLAVSRHSTVVKSGKIKDDIFKSLTKTDIFYDYHEFLNWWLEILGKDSITIRIMDDTAPKQIDSVQEMCAILGIDTYSLHSKSIRKNTFLSAAALDILNKINIITNNDDLKISSGLRKRIIHALEDIDASGRKLPDRDSAVQFDTLYAESNQKLAEKFNLSLPVFTVDYTKYPLSKPVVCASDVRIKLDSVARQIAGIHLDNQDSTSWKSIFHLLDKQMKLSKPSSESGPDFACVGFPKCATTFILKQFSEYSFDTLVKGEIQISKLDSYRHQIMNSHDVGLKVAIKNPNIIYSKRHMDQILGYGCKIIISIRNPVRWLKSFYNYRLKRIHAGMEHLSPDFKKIPTFGEIVNTNINFMDVCINNGMMSKIITDNLLKSEYYDSGRVLYLVQEELESDQETVRSTLLDFLEIPASQRRIDGFKFKSNNPNRWKFYNDDEYDEKLYEIYSEEINDLCSLIESKTGKNLSVIWEDFYGRKFD